MERHHESFIRLWNVAGTLHKPKGITFHCISRYYGGDGICFGNTLGWLQRKSVGIARTQVQAWNIPNKLHTVDQQAK